MEAVIVSLYCLGLTFGALAFTLLAVWWQERKR